MNIAKATGLISGYCTYFLVNFNCNKLKKNTNIKIVAVLKRQTNMSRHLNVKTVRYL